MHDACVWPGKPRSVGTVEEDPGDDAGQAAASPLMHAVYAMSASVWRLSKYSGKSPMNANLLALTSAFVRPGQAAGQLKSAGAVPRRLHSARNSGIVCGRLSSSIVKGADSGVSLESTLARISGNLFVMRYSG